MNRQNYFYGFSLLFFLSLLLSCDKDKEKDEVSVHTIYGYVRNNCTGGPFPDVEVILTINNGSTQKSKTDSLGNFSFPNVAVHSHSKYKYYLSVDSYTNYSINENGYSQINYEFYGIGKQELNKNEIGNKYTIGLSASCKLLYLYIPDGIQINSPDSFVFYQQQKVLHYYEPNRIWESTAFSYDGISYLSNESAYIGNHPMGLWHITVKKWKDGVYSEVQDSIYMDKGETKIYTIPW
jgi:hypothetical protein